MGIDWTLFTTDANWLQALVGVLVMAGSLIASLVAFWFSWESRRLAKEALVRADHAISIEKASHAAPLLSKMIDLAQAALDKMEAAFPFTSDDLDELIHSDIEDKFIDDKLIIEITSIFKESLIIMRNQDFSIYAKFLDKVDMDCISSEGNRIVSLDLDRRCRMQFLVKAQYSITKSRFRNSR